MTDWKKYFSDDNIFFVTPDVKRGLGFTGILSQYHIICTDLDPIIPALRIQGAKIFCLEEEGSVDVSEMRNSGKLLENLRVLEYIKNNSKGAPKVMYFKPSLKIDSLVKLHGFTPIGNNTALNELFEDKVSFAQIAKNIFPDYLLPSISGILGELNYPDLYGKLSSPLVLQFGHGWAGKTTFFINGEEEFEILSQKFPYTKVKISKFIEGFTVLNNCCLYQGQIYISSPAVQIDGIEELGSKPGATCGRQWPAKFITNAQVSQIEVISRNLGKLMNEKGFRGFLGIDFLIEEKTGKIYLSEVNARMTASAAFYTLLEIGSGSIPLLAYHMAEFLGKSIKDKFEENNNLVGSQVIMRSGRSLTNVDSHLFGVFKYENNRTKFIRDEYYPNKLRDGEYIFMGKRLKEGNSTDEFARIETKYEILEKPRKFNKQFKRIINNY